MWKRMVLMLVLTAAIVAALGLVKYRQIQAAVEAGASFQPPPEAVTTVVAQEAVWPATINVIGTVTAVQGVNVSADLPGIVSRIAFESGQSVCQGDVLVQLDIKQELAQLAAAETVRDLAKLDYARLEGLVTNGAVTRAEYDRAAAQEKQSDARVQEIRATIERKVIRAPFDGVLGIRQVNLGQYLSAGDPVVPLQSLDPIYVNFGIPQDQAQQIRIGSLVRITVGGEDGTQFQGRVNAKQSTVDETTRNLQIQATVANARGALRPGMFVQTELAVGLSRKVVPLPASSINHAPYGDSIYVVTHKKNNKGQTEQTVRQQFVKVEGARGDQVGVISGAKPGNEVVTSGLFKLRNGAAVIINNKSQPSNNPAAKPEDS
jgi:membrane fusion protein (multidrug efflux system)